MWGFYGVLRKVKDIIKRSLIDGFLDKKATLLLKNKEVLLVKIHHLIAPTTNSQRRHVESVRWEQQGHFLEILRLSYTKKQTAD